MYLVGYKQYNSISRRLASATGLAAVLTACLPRANPPKKLILWVWERPEDLRFLDTASALKVSVALLVATVRLGASGWELFPRHVPLQISPRVPLTAVVRIEVGQGAAIPAPEDVAGEILKLVTPSFESLQVDFDAPVSWRSFYRGLLAALRRRVKRLSMTALASWCMGDRWLSDLPVDEIVPMLFRMGRDGARIGEQLARSGQFTEPRCRESIGIATDEPVPVPHAVRRLYVFHPTAWDEESFEQFSRQLR